MNKEKIYDAVSGIDEKYLTGSEDAEGIGRSFRKARRKKSISFISLSLALILIAAAAVQAAGRANGQLTPIVTGEPDTTVTESAATSDESEKRGPFDFRSLTVFGHGPEKTQGGGLLDIAPFSEYCLDSADLVIEGTILETHRNKYHFVVEAPGKFENAGGKMKITYEGETIVTTVQIDRIWKGDAGVSVGDTISFEDETDLMNEVFTYQVGSTYFLHLEKNRGENLIRGSGMTDDETIIEGDNHRTYRYSNNYPHQPAIEKTKDGDYIVPETWETVAKESDAEVIVGEADKTIEATGHESWFAFNKLRLVRAADFEKRVDEIFKRFESEK